MTDDLKMSVGWWASRWTPAGMATPYAQRLEESGVVDELVVWDMVTNWWPPALWTPDVTPMAEQVPDIDSLQDPFIACAFAQAATQNLSVAVSTDSCRRDPPELLQTMLTLSNSTQGGARLLLGAGEARHIDPFGRDRSVGLKRMRDLLGLFQRWRDGDGPTDFDGRFWKLRDAWIGKGGFANPPEIMAMGGGPLLVKLATQLADGLVSGSPFVHPTPESYGQFVKEVNAALQERGRDATGFTHGLYHVMFLCDDPAEFEDNLDHPMLKWWAATGGRFNMADWREEGLEPALPDDWHYAWKMLPSPMSRAEVDAIIDRVPPEMVRKSFVAGTPEQVAELLKEYSAQGCQYHLLADLAPAMMPTDPERMLERYIEVCRLTRS